MKRTWTWTACAGLALAAAACDGKFSNLVNTATTVATTATSGLAQPAAAVDIGGPLYPPAEVPPASQVPAASQPQADAITVPSCQVTVPYSENVPSKNDGRLLAICTTLEPGDETRYPAADIIEVKTGSEVRKFRRLREGDTVKRGQLVGMLDDQIAQANMEVAAANKKAANLICDASLGMLAKSEQVVQIYMDTGKATSKVEKAKAEMEYAQAKRYLADAEGSRDKAVAEEKKARVQLEEHELRASIDGHIKTIYRKPGESVKALEPVLQVQSLDKLRVEGLMDVQYVPLLPNVRGKKVLIETAIQLAPMQELDGHLQPVTAVAVSKDANAPLIVSASEDRTVRVWDRATKQQKLMYTHPVAVRAVACTGPKSEANLILSGADDGYGRLFNLDEAGTDKAVRELKGRHTGRITSVAFSPDGQHCATADDKTIIIWNVTTGEKMYSFASDHKGPISAIQFTPMAKLVTVAKDRSIKVWSLGERAAKHDFTIDHRAGHVNNLGVSPDGTRILFDQDRELHIFNMLERRTEGVLPMTNDASNFNGFALFSPDARLILAGGTADNPLQIWRTPAAGADRGYLAARLGVGAGMPTTGAFAPNGGFAAVGTTDNKVLVFARPAEGDLSRQIEGIVTYLDRSIESTDRKVKIWAEVAKPGDFLIPGDTVMMVIPPQ